MFVMCLQVIDVSEISHIQKLRMLRQLNLLRNPIQELPDYRLAILFRIPSLTELDRHKVEVEEKVCLCQPLDLKLVGGRWEWGGLKGGGLREDGVWRDQFKTCMSACVYVCVPACLSV